MMIRQFVPAGLKRPLKQMYASHLLASGLAALRSGVVTDEQLIKVRTGWANDGWDAKPVLLREIVAALRATSGPVLECGSGLSTLVMAALAPERARISLEHHPEWANRVATALAAHDLSADVRIAPLGVHENGLSWYASGQPLPDDIGLVICDGPETYGPGRYPVLPIVRRHLAPGAVIVFDDAAEEGQPAVLQAWHREFGAQVERRHSEGVDYAIVRVP